MQASNSSSEVKGSVTSCVKEPANNGISLLLAAAESEDTLFDIPSCFSVAAATAAPQETIADKFAPVLDIKQETLELPTLVPQNDIKDDVLCENIKCDIAEKNDQQVNLLSVHYIFYTYTYIHIYIYIYIYIYIHIYV